MVAAQFTLASFPGQGTRLGSHSQCWQNLGCAFPKANAVARALAVARQHNGVMVLGQRERLLVWTGRMAKSHRLTCTNLRVSPLGKLMGLEPFHVSSSIEPYVSGV